MTVPMKEFPLANHAGSQGQVNAVPAILAAIFAVFSVILGVFLMADPGFAADDQSMTCEICGEAIHEGRYIIIEDHTFHESCFKQAKKCAICGLPISGTPQEGRLGRHYHTSCFHDAMKCYFCKDAIIGENYLRLEDGTTVHENCVKHLPTCAACQGPLGEHTVQKNGATVHEACADKLKLCDICGDFIIGEFRKDLYGRIICEKHFKKAACSVCQYADIVRNLPDGRVLCQRCNETAVFQKTLAEVIFQFTRDELRKTFGMALPDNIQLHLVDARTMPGNQYHQNSINMGKMQHDISETKTAKGIIIKKESQFRIYVLNGLPESLMQGIIAHELVHVWQELHCQKSTDQQYREGIAELVSYLTHKKQNRVPWMTMIEQNILPLYRDGFLRARQRYEREGSAMFLKPTSAFCSMDDD